MEAGGLARTAEAAQPAANLTTSSPCLDSFTATITDLITYFVSANSDTFGEHNNYHDGSDDLVGLVIMTIFLL